MKRIGEFLCTCEEFPLELELFIQNLSEAIGNRLKKLADNKFLRMATIMDPRFAYSEDYFTKIVWNFIEDDLLEFAKESKFLNTYFRLIY